MKPLSGLSVDAARREVAARLRSAGIETPELDARLLIGAALRLDHTGLAAQARREITSGESATVEDFVSRRLVREPIARIIGYREFWGRDFRVTDATLVPRPETEAVVAAALSFLHVHQRSSGETVIADIGTGSGAILLSLLSELPNARGVGVDISDEALEIARANFERLDLGDRAQFMTSNYGANLSGPFDVIVSNPPYVASRDIEHLAPDVRDYDPRLALDGGNDGLDAYRIIAPQAQQLLRTEGALIVEIGHDQATGVSEIFAAAKLTVQGAPQLDLSGTQRVITAVKP
ncbi:MAG: peptide chain release factor N(5)-glutamine methyltransferase [Afipia sp.]|nr:peptide chain release factor N(5)-glutamine methyltransferase [Afipia sp.]